MSIRAHFLRAASGASTIRWWLMGTALLHLQVPSWTGLGFDMRQRCIELMDAALVCSITDKYAREARAEEEAQK